MASETKPARVDSATLPGGADSAQGANSIISGVMRELEQVLDTKHVIGEPMTFGNSTVIPLMSIGFGFGGGSGGGGGSKDGEVGQGGGGGGGAGGGVKPIAVLVIGEDGVRVEPIAEPPTGLDRLGNAIAGALERRGSSSDDD